MAHAKYESALSCLNVAEAPAVIESEGEISQQADKTLLRQDLAHLLELPVVDVRPVRKIELRSGTSCRPGRLQNAKERGAWLTKGNYLVHLWIGTA